MKSLSLSLLLVSTLAVFDGPAAGTETAPKYRTWTDAKGEYTVEAAFVKLVDGAVKLKRKSDGKLVSIPLERLSKADAVLATIEQRRQSEPKVPPAKRRAPACPPATDQQAAGADEPVPVPAPKPKPKRAAARAKIAQRAPVRQPQPNDPNAAANQAARRANAQWPDYLQPIGVGRSLVCVVNLTGQPVTFGLRSVSAGGLRSGQLGKDFAVEAKPPKSLSTAASLYVPEGEYDIYFLAADAADQIHEGGRFKVAEDSPAIHVINGVNGQVNVRRIDLNAQVAARPDDIVIPGAIIPQPDIVIPGAIIPQPDLVIPGATIPQPAQPGPNGISIPQPPIRLPDTRILQPPTRLPDIHIPQPPLRLPDIRIPRP